MTVDRVFQRTLAGSAIGHAALLTLVVLVGGLTAKKVVQPDVPFLEIIPTDLKLTMGNQIGGGTPNPRPLAAVEGTPPPSAVTPPKPPPVTEVPRVEPKPVEPQVKPSPPEPVSEPKPEEPTAKTREPEPKVEVPKDIRPTAQAQDVDTSRKAEKTPPKIQISREVRTVNATDRKKAAREAREAREAKEAKEAAAAEAKAQRERAASAQKLAARFAGAATGVSQNVGGSTKIEMPGPGGAAYAPYTSWLQTFLYQQWHRPATTASGNEWVGVQLTISKDGTVLDVTIKRSSGVRSLDASVEEIFRRNRKLRPLPEEFNESRLVVPVKFVLEASASL